LAGYFINHNGMVGNLDANLGVNLCISFIVVDADIFYKVEYIPWLFFAIIISYQI